MTSREQANDQPITRRAAVRAMVSLTLLGGAITGTSLLVMREPGETDASCLNNQRCARCGAASGCALPAARRYREHAKHTGEGARDHAG